MTVTITDDHPNGWCMAVTDDEPAEVRETASTLTRQVREGTRGIPSSTVLKAYVGAARHRAQREANIATDAQRKAGFALARDLLLDRDDRLALAEVVCGRDVTSWSELSWSEMSAVLTAMSGYVAVRHLRLERSRGPA